MTIFLELDWKGFSWCTAHTASSHPPHGQLQGGDKLGVLLRGDLNSGVLQVFTYPCGGS